MDVIYTWIKNIIIYMILNTIIMNLLGNSSYKKYVSIVSGMILVLIVISPLMNVMDLEDNLDYFIQSNEFAVETSNFQSDLSQMEEKQKDLVFDEYQKKIQKQITDMLLVEGVYLTNISLTLDMDVASDSYGQIKNIKMSASMKSSEEDVNTDTLRIDEIDINSIDISGEEDKTTENLPSPMEINIKNKLSDFYNIEPDNINISIQGG